MYFTQDNDRVFGFFVNSRGLRIILGNGQNRANAVISVPNALACAKKAMNMSNNIVSIPVDYRQQSGWSRGVLTLSNPNDTSYQFALDLGGSLIQVNATPEEFECFVTACKNLHLYIGIGYAIFKVHQDETRQARQYTSNTSNYTANNNYQPQYRPQQQQQTNTTYHIPQQSQTTQYNNNITPQQPTQTQPSPDDDVPF